MSWGNRAASGPRDLARPKEPTLTWRPWRTFKTWPTTDQLGKAMEELLDDPEFFRRCTECHQRNNIGHMHGDVCQPCA